MREETLGGAGYVIYVIEGGRSRVIAFFFRPTPYGFRQVVQHVSKHVAYEIN